MQMTIFDVLYPKYIISKPIRLIELFAGIGSQAMALRELGADFEHYRAIEIDKPAMAAYNAIHGTAFKPADITKVKGKYLGITEKEKYSYIMTYSFPCQDLSPAGKRKGMAKGAKTRSGLLWEVERLLNETTELPDILLMENVPDVANRKNISQFHDWQDFLAAKGYKNYVRMMNAADYGVAQNRNRCFMASLLGDFSYSFPEPIALGKTIADYLEEKVSEKYYINTEAARLLVEKYKEKQANKQARKANKTNINEAGHLEKGTGKHQSNKVYGTDGTARTLTAHDGTDPMRIIL
ncbi:MAG: DNA (cytosine-5-)-methyltransferase [Lachnospiraceae bacterium]|nr:DNA (cytosine-5-)-methyltransferase [Lachnospiraceae bacterium]